jgi:hypothetical protein
MLLLCYGFYRASFPQALNLTSARRRPNPPRAGHFSLETEKGLREGQRVADGKPADAEHGLPAEDVARMRREMESARRDYKVVAGSARLSGAAPFARNADGR